MKAEIQSRAPVKTGKYKKSWTVGQLQPLMPELHIVHGDDVVDIAAEQDAVLGAVQLPVYEHRENADMDELTRMLRYILATEREVAF